MYTSTYSIYNSEMPTQGCRYIKFQTHVVQACSVTRKYVPTDISILFLRRERRYVSAEVHEHAIRQCGR